jgi:hypothetical protein
MSGVDIQANSVFHFTPHPPCPGLTFGCEILMFGCEKRNPSVKSSCLGMKS